MIRFVWFLLISVILHLSLFLSFPDKQYSNAVKLSSYDRTLQVVLYERQNNIKNNKVHFLAKHNYSTERETQLHRGVADILQADINGVLNKLSGESGNKNYIPDVEYGDVMALNTQGFKYYSFYERVQSAISPYWTYRLRKLLREHGEVFKNDITKDYITDLSIYLDSDGYLKKIQILKSSGVKEYDDLCQNVFGELSPFVNPPKELIINGYAKMNWRFILSLVKRASFNIVPF